MQDRDVATNRRPELSAATQGIRRKSGFGIALLGAFALLTGAPASAAEPPPAATPAAKPAAANVTPMSQEQLLEHQAKHPQQLFVLDVRSPEEFKEGHVPGAVNVPYDQIASRLADVPKD